MNKTLIFLLGALTGGGTVWYFTKEYYRRLADAEIDSVLGSDRYEKKAEEKKEEKKEEVKKKDNKIRYEELTRNYTKPSVTDYASKYDHEGEIATDHPVDDDEEDAYVISPQEFGELDDYDKITLNYYADGYLVEGESVIENVNDVIGPDALDSFGDYEDDAVYVRNDKLRTDYEVLYNESNFIE